MNGKKKAIILWFRQDLRLEDHPPFYEAAQAGQPIIPLYIWAPEEESAWAPGGAARWWLHGSLLSLQGELQKYGLSLILRRGPSLATLIEILAATGAEGVYWNRRYEPEAIKRDAHIKTELRKQGKIARSFNGTLLFEPWTVLNKQGKPFQVFTPFWKHCCGLEEPNPLPKPKEVICYEGALESLSVNTLALRPTIPWDKGFNDCWCPGVAGAHEKLQRALNEAIAHYPVQRDFPSLRGTSELSPHLHFGEISPRIIWKAVRQTLDDHERANAYLRQLGWREFAYSLLYHFPHTTKEPLHLKFASFPWKADGQMLRAWQKGQTGYPIVDAGMRQLWKTGWMHNRVRMIVGSFLVKDLLISWTKGAEWFWDTLVDADLANNTLGWQWVAGCGADAAPYFRVFNPITQGEKFDAQGDYVRRWVPEIASLPNRWIHKPWDAPAEELRQAGIVLGSTYPAPIINHDQARLRALEAFAHIKEHAL